MDAARIRVQHEDGRIEERTLALGTYAIGRNAGGLPLSDSNVSGLHAELRIQPGAVDIVDMGSSNGTFDMAGNRLVQPKGLRPNEWVRLGNSSITVIELATPARGGTQLMPQVAPVAAPPAVHEPWMQPAAPTAPAYPAVATAPASPAVATAPASPAVATAPGWVVLFVGWVIILIPLPLTGIAGTVVAGTGGMVLAVVNIVRGAVAVGILQLMCAVLVTPIVYLIGLFIFGAGVAVFQ